MPVDLNIVEEQEKEEREAKLHPRRTKEISRLQKKRITASLTHWVVVDANGRQWGRLFKNHEEVFNYINTTLDPIKEPFNVQKLTCHGNIPCGNCDEKANFLRYHQHNIIYGCKNNHTVVISEYD